MIIWKDIRGYTGLYQVSNTGKIKSLPRIVKCGVNRTDLKPIQERILADRYNHDGYVIVILCKKGKKKTLRVHRLVAKSFIPNPHHRKEVNHKDGDKLNNNDWNLEWNTHKQNMHHAIKHGIAGALKSKP